MTNYKHFIIFLFVFMILQYILLNTEWQFYLAMASDIQGHKFNFYKNEKHEFIFKNIIICSLGYIGLVYFLYYYIILPKKSYFEGFIFMCIIYLMWDVSVFFMSDKGSYYVPLLLYDAIIVGGVCMLISHYFFNNYYDILKNNILILFILYLLTMIWSFYECYRYNPDLSNIKRVVLF